MVLQLVMARGLIRALATSATSTSRVQLARDRVSDVRELLLGLLEVLSGGSGGVLVKPLGGLLNGIENLV